MSKNKKGCHNELWNPSLKNGLHTKIDCKKIGRK